MKGFSLSTVDWLSYAVIIQAMMALVEEVPITVSTWVPFLNRWFFEPTGWTWKNKGKRCKLDCVHTN